MSFDIVRHTDLPISLCRYLYEINELAELEILCTVNLAAVATLEDSPQRHSLNATIMSHQANLAESQGKAEMAIYLNKEVYRIRFEELPLKYNLLCQVANNIGYCYNSFNDHTTALTWFLTSYEWFEKSEETKNDFLLGNMARCMLYLNQLDAAWEMLDIAIPQLENSNPSNWAMLS
jgi:tetratricopeptide (TPR) repeat protein